MAAGPGNALGRQVRRAVRLPDRDDLSDGQLLAQFLADRDEAAFEALVRRHAAMVLGVCRRVAGNAADADDAFQAAFVVLVRRGRELTGRATVGDWLYGVAYRTALKARAMAVKRRAREHAAARSVEAPPAADPPDWLPLLDEELNRLPRKYREPLVLCELEGRARKEVAGRLGVPEGTLSSRLAAAKKRLADRLRKRGFALSGGLVGLTGSTAPAIPPSLVESAVAAATGAIPAAVSKLVGEVTRAMFLDKLRTGLVILTAALLAGAVGLAAIAGPPQPGPPEPKTLLLGGGPTARLLKEVKAAQQALEGTWELHKLVIDDDEEQPPRFAYYRYTFAERTVKIEYKRRDEVYEGESSYTVNPTTTPPEITIYRKDLLVMGVYELNGDTLRIAHYGNSELERPRGFAVKDKRIADLPLIVWEFKRKKPEKQPPAAARADEPAWKKEFDAAYGLKDGHNLKLVPSPFPGSRTGFYDTLKSDVPQERMLIVMAQDGRKFDERAMGSRYLGGPDEPGWPVRKHLQHAVGILPQEIEGDADALATLVDADVVVRRGAAVDLLLKDLESELREKCSVRVKLDVRQEEREVVIARGKYALKRGPGGEMPTVDVYARQTLDQPSAEAFTGTERFLDHLGEFIGRRMIDETDPASRDVALRHRYHMRRPATPTTKVEDTDPEKVLKNVAAQTGLTFTTEKRKVRVLVVEAK
jgi:RNA polymerase sigma factor (sigma-70 family)